MAMLRAAVLTISDSCAAGQAADRSGPAVVGALRSRGWDVVSTMVLPDDVDDVRRALETLADGGDVSAVFTTGGTGVAPRDVTPEATRQVIKRDIPGLAELMRSEGGKKTRRAALSRGLAGLRGSVLIVNLPGSTRGALESLEAIAELLPHVVELARGLPVRHD
jgi:molybdenum cofactor synthesis domain-containing protein